MILQKEENFGNVINGC